MVGWGASCEGVFIGEQWHQEKLSCHINELELLAVFYWNYNVSNLKLVYLFLNSLFRKSLPASAVNVARSALSNALPQVGGVDVGKCKVISRQLKGVHKLRPQK